MQMDDMETFRVPELIIDKWWREDNGYNPEGYFDEEDLYYTNPINYIQSKILDFCICGDPQEVQKYTMSMLQKLRDHKASHFTSELIDFTPENYFMWYVLHRLELTEHGGSVPGWLTKKGEELLHDLEIMYV